ncbi:MAG: ester cyclase [Halobacteriales archaeon]|nr:ester cyclase [Halobacteriales archaeon]
MTATEPVETNKDLIRGVYEAINERRDGDLSALYSSDCVIHAGPGATGVLSGREGIAQQTRVTREAFPDITATIEAMIAEEDLVTARVSYDATHQGEYLGVPATGNDVRFEGTNVFRIEAGEIAEVWPMIDTLGVLQQLGVSELPDA